MKLDRRKVERLEATLRSVSAAKPSPTQDVLADYFAILEGADIEVSRDAELEAYFESLEEQAAEIEAAITQRKGSYQIS